MGMGRTNTLRERQGRGDRRHAPDPASGEGAFPGTTPYGNLRAGRQSGGARGECGGDPTSTEGWGNVNSSARVVLLTG